MGRATRIILFKTVAISFFMVIPSDASTYNLARGIDVDQLGNDKGVTGTAVNARRGGDANLQAP